MHTFLAVVISPETESMLCHERAQSRVQHARSPSEHTEYGRCSCQVVPQERLEPERMVGLLMGGQHGHTTR